MTDTEQEILSILETNTLFSGFSHKQLEEIIPLVKEVHYDANIFILREDHVSNEIYIIKQGEVELLKRSTEGERQKRSTDGAHLMRLTTLGVGQAIGETSLLGNAPHATSVRTLVPTTLYSICIEELKALSQEHASNTQLILKLTDLIRDVQLHTIEQSIHTRLISNVAQEISGRLRRTNLLAARSLKQELDYTKMRVAMGSFLINVLSVIAFYIFAFKSIEALAHSTMSTTVISIPLIFMFTVAVLVIMKSSGYPMSFYGLTFTDWKIAVKEAILYTLPCLVIILLVKIAVVNLFTNFQHLPIFDIGANIRTNSSEAINPIIPILIIMGYLILTPIQELLVRGALQSSLQEFLVGPNKTLWAIFISNLIFTMLHVHISLSLAAAVFIPGLLWGWLYARHKTLLGVSLSHLIIGGWSFFILGFQKILII